MSSDQNRTIFCFGLGYTALNLVEGLLQEGWTALGTTKDPDKAQALSLRGIKTFILDSNAELPDLKEPLSRAAFVLSSIPPDGEGDIVIDQYGNELERLSEAGSLQWCGYLSTTGVYGDRGGGWVDETSEPQPVTERAKRRVKAEQQWLNSFSSSAVPAHVFRLAGIYGPYRSILDRLASGTMAARALRKEGHVFGRVHVGDIVQVLRASMHHPNPSQIYNVCDDLPSAASDVEEYARQLMGLAPRPDSEVVDLANNPKNPDVGEVTKSFWSECKRVRNNKIKEELSVQLLFPTYAEGLKHIYQNRQLNTTK